MDMIAIIAALGVFLIAAPAFFFFGRKTGVKTELDRQGAAKATAEETTRRMLGEAERAARIWHLDRLNARLKTMGVSW